MKFPNHVFWRPVSKARWDYVPVLAWDGFRFWIAIPSPNRTFIEEGSNDEIDGLIAWADIPSPPSVAKKPSSAADFY